MEESEIKFWVDIAQIATTILTLVGVIFSIWISTKSLREIHKDRVFNQRPYLIFDYGGYVIPIEFRKHENGKDFIKAYWPPLGEKGGVHIITYGHLKNLGTGPAIEIRITWVVELIYIKGEKFKIDEDKRSERQYLPENNTNPLSISHLFPNQETGLHLLPYFISQDIEKKIERADGHFIIKYSDTFENNYQTKQKFHVFTDYNNPQKGFHTTFSDLVRTT